jgi:hypothetical protein
MKNQGGSNRLIYDNCAYAQWVWSSTQPLHYQMYMGKNENCNKCRQDKFWHPYDLVDVESELRLQTRPASKCGMYKYNPTCPMSKSCISTNDPKVPVVLPPECCPIVFNNIPKRTDPGYVLPSTQICSDEEMKAWSPV